MRSCFRRRENLSVFPVLLPTSSVLYFKQAPFLEIPKQVIKTEIVQAKNKMSIPNFKDPIIRKKKTNRNDVFVIALRQRNMKGL